MPGPSGRGITARTAPRRSARAPRATRSQPSRFRTRCSNASGPAATSPLMVNNELVKHIFCSGRKSGVVGNQTVVAVAPRDVEGLRRAERAKDGEATFFEVVVPVRAGCVQAAHGGFSRCPGQLGHHVACAIAAREAAARGEHPRGKDRHRARRHLLKPSLPRAGEHPGPAPGRDLSDTLLALGRRQAVIDRPCPRLNLGQPVQEQLLDLIATNSRGDHDTPPLWREGRRRGDPCPVWD
jgi:hypothetical protein